MHGRCDAIALRALLGVHESPAPSSMSSAKHLCSASGIHERYVKGTCRHASRRTAPIGSDTSKRMKKSSCPSCPGVSFVSSSSCVASASGLLPGGDGDGWRYIPAVCATGDSDSSHRTAQGMCTRIGLALAGRDAVNFWRRPIAALLMRTFIMSSPVRRRGSARGGQPLTTARSEDGPRASGPSPNLHEADRFKVYRKERCWCGVQRFSRIGATRGF